MHGETTESAKMDRKIPRKQNLGKQQYDAQNGTQIGDPPNEPGFSLSDSLGSLLFFFFSLWGYPSHLHRSFLHLTCGNKFWSESTETKTGTEPTFVPTPRNGLSIGIDVDILANL